jgi:Ca2+-binding RTX toxin-like protein
MKTATTRRGVLLLASMLVALVVFAGVALAAVRNGTDGDDKLIGTEGFDILRGHGGSDFLNGKRGADRLVGGPQADAIWDGPLSDQRTDYIYAGAGNDRIDTNNEPDHKDVIECGIGRDTIVSGDPQDLVQGGCETFSQVE